jgi:3-oxoacyl-[acyl-carrier-protein] synthase III
MGTKISSIEYYLPEKIVTNNQLAREFVDWSAKKIERKIGIRERHIVKENETALDLALVVGEKILENTDKESIDFLLLCTQSPEYYLPSGACIIQDRLGLRQNIGAFDYNLGCSGYIYGLSMAKSFIKSNIAENVLLITTETYSKYIHPKDKSNRTIFGDAATATIITKSNNEQIGEFSLGTDGSGYNNLIVPNGGLRTRYNQHAEEQIDTSGNIRTANNLYMNGPEIFNFTIQAVPKVINDTLEKNNIRLDDVDYVIFHQANKYINEYLRKKINIPEKKFCDNLLLKGNTVSNTIPIAIKDAIDGNIIKEGDKVLLVGFGVGYSWGATILNI